MSLKTRFPPTLVSGGPLFLISQVMRFSCRSVSSNSDFHPTRTIVLSGPGIMVIAH